MFKEEIYEYIKLNSVSKYESLLKFNFSVQPIIGIDPGEKRVGISLVNELGYPYPLTTLKRAQGRAEKTILMICEELRIETMVIGIPLDHKELEIHPACKFLNRIEKRFFKDIITVDESLSSEEAMDIILYSDIENPVKFFTDRIKKFLSDNSININNLKKIQRVKQESLKLRNSGIIDSISAAIILNRYLELGRRRKKEEGN